MIHIEDCIDILFSQPDPRFFTQKTLLEAELADLGEIARVYVADGQGISGRIDVKAFTMAVLPVYKEFTVGPKAALTGIQGKVQIHQAAVAGGVVRNKVETMKGFTRVGELHRKTVISKLGPVTIQSRMNPCRPPVNGRG